MYPGGSDGKASAYNVGDLGSNPGSGRSPGEGNDNPLQYSCLENPMVGGAWWAYSPWGRKESQTRLSDFTFFHYVNDHSPSWVCFVVGKPRALWAFHRGTQLMGVENGDGREWRLLRKTSTLTLR